MSVRVAPASIKDKMMGKLYKLRRDIKRNPDKYKYARWGYYVTGAHIYKNGKIVASRWSNSYKKFIEKVLREL